MVPLSASVCRPRHVEAVVPRVVEVGAESNVVQGPRKVTLQNMEHSSSLGAERIITDASVVQYGTAEPRRRIITDASVVQYLTVLQSRASILVLKQPQLFKPHVRPWGFSQCAHSAQGTCLPLDAINALHKHRRDSWLDGSWYIISRRLPRSEFP